MNNEKFFVFETCSKCGATIEIEVNENYLAMENEFSKACNVCKNIVITK